MPAKLIKPNENVRLLDDHNSCQNQMTGRLLRVLRHEQYLGVIQKNNVSYILRTAYSMTAVGETFSIHSAKPVVWALHKGSSQITEQPSGV